MSSGYPSDFETSLIPVHVDSGGSAESINSSPCLAFRAAVEINLLTVSYDVGALPTPGLVNMPRSSKL